MGRRLKLETGLCRAVVLCSCLGLNMVLAACAVQTPETGSQKLKVSGAEKSVRQIAPHMATVWGDPNESIVFVEKDWDIKNMTLHNLKTMSAEEIYSLTPKQLQELKDNTTKSNPLSEQDWQSIFKTVQKYHPLEWWFARIEHLAKQGCEGFSAAQYAGNPSYLVYVPDSVKLETPQYFKTYPYQYDKTITHHSYVGPPYNQNRPWDTNDFIRLDDYRYSKYSHQDVYFPAKLFQRKLSQNVFLTGPMVQEGALADCSDTPRPKAILARDLVHFAYYSGTNNYCKLLMRMGESYAYCIDSKPYFIERLNKIREFKGRRFLTDPPITNGKGD